LLGLPPLMKRHRGSDIAEEILAIIRFFEIQDCVGYCTLDNESKNRTTMAKIGEALGLDAEERQISCGPHVLQLCTRALMYGEGCKQGSNPYHEIHIWIHNVDPYPFHSIPRGLLHFHIHATEPLPHVPYVEIVERNGHFWWGLKIPGFPCEIAHTPSTFYRPQQQNKNDFPPRFIRTQS
jgi:hypothetical protein